MESKGKLVPKNERILRAAEAVFSKKGYRQATLDEIVKIADTGMKCTLFTGHPVRRVHFALYD